MCIESPFSRADFLRTTTTAGFAVATVAAPVLADEVAPRGPIQVRWLGGGVTELSTPDSKQIMLVDAWIWNNAGYTRFNLQKPPELSSAAAYADHLVSRKPEGVFVLLTHDHGDHIGDYFELLKTLQERNLNVKTIGQADLIRVGLRSEFKGAGLDEASIVANGGSGANFGGVGTHAGMRATVVPAFHSTTSGFPTVGFIAQIGGTKVYASGDTGIFGDMALIGRHYKPDLAIVCVGNGASTMNPEDAAEAARMIGAPIAIPVHYAHTASVLGTDAGDRFRAAVTHVAPHTRVIVMKPGESTKIA